MRGLHAQRREQEPSASPGSCRRSVAHDAVIVYLLPNKNSTRTYGGCKDWSLALESLRSLRSLKDGGRAEVRVFYDQRDDFTDNDIEDVLTAAAPRDICMVPIEFSKFPEGMHEALPSPWVTPLRCNPTAWGYEHMIRFFFADIFETNLLQGFKYWMRLDTDAILVEVVDGDPFRYFDEQPDLTYIHNDVMNDCGSVAKGLYEFSHEYLSKRGRGDVAALNASARSCVEGYYNNVELGRIADFQTAPMQSWRDAVDASRGIYLHRWGDALLRRLSLEIVGARCAPLPKELKKGYRHGQNFFKNLDCISKRTGRMGDDKHCRYPKTREVR